jgi:hypothetical protein
VKFGTDRHLPLSACTNCGHVTNCATGVDETNDDLVPSAGSFTICIHCGHIMAFTKDLTLRNLTAEEVIMVAGDRRIIAIQHARAMIERDRAYCENFVRTTIKAMDQPMPPDWQINLVVDKVFKSIPRPLRKPR